MFKRSLGGLAAVLGFAGFVQAQYHQGRPAYVPSRPAYAPDVRTVAADGAVPKAATTPSVPAPTSTLDPSSPFAQDVGAACGDNCGVVSGCCDCLCGPPGRFWVGAEWLFWTTSGNKYPPLLTGSPAGTPLNQAGNLNNPNTSTLVGGDQAYNDQWRSGLRVYGGMWLDKCQKFGLEWNFFYLGNSNDNASYSQGSQILARPFQNNVIFDPATNTFVPTNGFQDTQLLPGTFGFNSTSEFWGAGANFVRNICCDPCGRGRTDLILGYRYLSLKDSLTITEDFTGDANSAFPGVRFQIRDYFATENYFNGAVIGISTERRSGAFFYGLRATVALGNTHSVVTIDGSTTISDPGPPAQTIQGAGGLLTQPSNIGTHTHDAFSVVPEVGLKAGIQVTDHLRVFAGYNFIYWSNVIRPGDVIDTRVNASQLVPRDQVVGTPYPLYQPSRSGYFAHGLSLGLELRY